MFEYISCATNEESRLLNEYISCATNEESRLLNENHLDNTELPLEIFLNDYASTVSDNESPLQINDFCGKGRHLNSKVLF